MSKNNGGTAFPTPGTFWDAGNQSQCEADDGMTMRDYFAAKAMQGLTQWKYGNVTMTTKETAELAYKMADAMIAERSKS